MKSDFERCAQKSTEQNGGENIYQPQQNEDLPLGLSGSGKAQSQDRICRTYSVSMAASVFTAGRS